MKFSILGPLEVRRGDEPLPLGTAKQRALLAVLLLNANEVISRDRLIDSLWGERPPESASHTLEAYVSRLRKILHADGEQVLLTRPPGYVLRVEFDDLDFQRFERLVEEGRRALAHDPPERAAALLREALSLWRGRALADIEYEPFAQAEAQRLEELRLAALEDEIEAELALGRHAAVVPRLQSLVAEHPLRERLRAQLMVALYRAAARRTRSRHIAMRESTSSISLASSRAQRCASSSKTSSPTRRTCRRRTRSPRRRRHDDGASARAPQPSPPGSSLPPDSRSALPSRHARARRQRASTVRGAG